MVIRTKDKELIESILEHESVKPNSQSDETTLEYAESDFVYWLTNKERDCLSVFYPILNNVYSAHISCLPEARGKRGMCFGRDSIQWMFENTDAIKLMGFTPEHLKHAYRYARHIGFEPQGFLSNSFMKDGKMYGYYISGVTKCQQQQ